METKPSSATPNLFSNWGTVKHEVSQGSILGPSLFITYINDLPSTITILSESIIFADDNTVMISNKITYDFCPIANTVLSHTIRWFTKNKIALSSDKTKIIKSVTNNSPQCALSVEYNGKYIEVSKYKIPWSTN
jgi:hypothetical protein